LRRGSQKTVILNVVKDLVLEVVVPASPTPHLDKEHDIFSLCKRKMLPVIARSPGAPRDDVAISSNKNLLTLSLSKGHSSPVSNTG
jgi:hypothetical protein